MNASNDPRVAFLEAATWHGTLEEANAILAKHPGLATSDIHTAAVLGDEAAVRRIHRAGNPGQCHREEPSLWRRRAQLLVPVQVSPPRPHAQRRVSAGGRGAARRRSGPQYRVLDDSHQPERSSRVRSTAPRESRTTRRSPASCSSAVPIPTTTRFRITARKATTTKPCGYWWRAGGCQATSLATMLVRKHDWHDYEGIRWLLEHGADPNVMTHWGLAAAPSGGRRDNALQIIELLLDHGADPTAKVNGGPVAMAAGGAGRPARAVRAARDRDRAHGVDRLIAACARDDGRRSGASRAASRNWWTSCRPKGANCWPGSRAPATSRGCAPARPRRPSRGAVRGRWLFRYRQEQYGAARGGVEAAG